MAVHKARSNVTGTLDINETTILRAGNVTDAEISTLNLGKDGLKPNDVDAATDTLSRDTDNPLGMNGIPQNSINANLYFKHTRVPATSGIDIHGTHVNGLQSTTTTLVTDEAADDDGYVDAGTFIVTRSGTPDSNDFPVLT